MLSRLGSGIALAVVLGLVASLVFFSGSQLVGEASPLLQTAPTLGAAASFAILGGSTVTNTGPSVINADLGVSPGSAVTGFPPGAVVNGTIHTADGVAQQAQLANANAYSILAGTTPCIDLSGKDLGGMTLTHGVYCFSSSAQLTGTLTLDAQGSASNVFIFKIGSTLTTASNSSVLMINSGSACNVFFQVGSSATLGTTTRFQGNILALTSISLNTGANIVGRALAQNGAVTLDSNTVGSSACVVGLNTPVPAVAAAFASQTAVAAAATATFAAIPPPNSSRKPAPAPTVTPPSPTPTLGPGAATATAQAAATATAQTAATTLPAAPSTPAAPVVAAAAAASTATPANTAVPVAANAPATSQPGPARPPAPVVPVPAPAPAPPIAAPPTSLPRTGTGLPPVGLLSLLIGALAVTLALTLRRTRR